MAIVTHSRCCCGEWMNYIALFSAVMLFSLAFIGQAEARKARFFAIPGFGGGETIDLVYDLPDNPAFLREGKAFDLGYLNSSNGNAYVLYHGDRYSKLSDTDIARLKAMLGFDPTTKHRMEQASRGTGAGVTGWGLVIFIAVGVLGLSVLIHKGLNVMRWMMRALTTPAAIGSDEAVSTPLEVRKKKLVNRQWSDTDHAARSPTPSAMQASSRSDAPVRAFGRRNV